MIVYYCIYPIKFAPSRHGLSILLTQELVIPRSNPAQSQYPSPSQYQTFLIQIFSAPLPLLDIVLLVQDYRYVSNQIRQERGNILTSVQDMIGILSRKWSEIFQDSLPVLRCESIARGRMCEGLRRCWDLGGWRGCSCWQVSDDP